MINSSNMVEKFDRMQKHDAFSDWRDGFITGTLGVSQQARDILQPVIDKGQNLLPPGGAVPPTEGLGAWSNVVATSQNFADKLMAPKIFGIPIIPVAIVIGIGYMMVKKGK